METKTIHITTAQGPVECQLAAAKTLAEILVDLRSNGLVAEVIARVSGSENGTISSATLKVTGISAGRCLLPWLGTIQWIQKSPYRPHHGRRNWYVGIFELEQLSNATWKESDLVFQSVRSSGAGGQHVNKVSSAVRVTHSPTGISTFVQDGRSQFLNKKLARERIAKKLEEHFRKQVGTLVEQQWGKHHELERGNPVKVFEGMGFKPRQPEKSFRKERHQLKQNLHKELKS